MTHHPETTLQHMDILKQQTILKDKNKKHVLQYNSSSMRF